MSLHLLAHSDLNSECCGCLIEVVVNDKTEFLCNECGLVLSKEEVALIILALESCEATCTHCGRVNTISGFSSVEAFTCRYCGRGVDLGRGGELS